ncbi:MAG: dihydropteroate synthase [Desulfobacteraceae bacterium]|nr:MAG: dihydropteroate synthase [Desulfobacteraceae bacterium]
MLIAADNLRITNRSIQAALDQMDPGPIRELAARCVAAGAQAIDINSGPLSRCPEEKMTFLVETVQSETTLPLILDTSNPKALEAGLITSKNKTIINGFSLEPRKLSGILPLAKKYHSDIIGYLLFPNSQVPVDEADCIQVALELFDAFKKAGLENEQLIIDPVVAPLIWEDGMRHNRGILSVIRLLPELLGFPVRTIAGISNLATGSLPTDTKRRLECAFLPMLAAAGLSMALINVLHKETLKTARICHSFLNPGVFSWAEI